MKGFLQRVWRTRWPWSVRILIGVGALFLLQAFPYTGVFLMLFAASLWSAPLINLAVIVAGLEALTGRIPRGLVLVPILWFGLYAIAVVREEAGLVQAQSDVSQTNASVRPIDYDPEKHGLVANGFTSSVRLKNFVDKLLLNHSLPVVYYEAGRENNRTMWAARLATGSLCESLAERKRGTKVKVSNYHQSWAKFHNIGATTKVCIVAFAERPTHQQTIRVSQVKSVERVGGLSVRMRTTTASSDDQQAQVHRASAAVLRRFPVPMLGCALNSGAPSWDCFAAFMRRKRVWFGENTHGKVDIGKVLKFTGTPPRGFGQAANQVVVDRLRDADNRFDADRYALLEEFLQDPAAFGRDRTYTRLFQHEPEKLSPYADRIVSTLVEAANKAKPIDEKTAAPVRAIAKLAALLSDEDIHRNSGQILSALDRRKQRWHNNIRPLMRRTASLREAAVPMLIRRLERHSRQRRLSRYESDAVIALCRMGLPYAEPAGPKLLEIWRRRNSKRQLSKRLESKRKAALDYPSLDRADKHVYLALLRLGLADEAGRPKSTTKSKWWARSSQSIGPQSSADTCEDV